MTLAAVAACTGDAEQRAPQSATQGPRRGGTVVFGVLGAPPTLDPYSPRATDVTFFLARPLYPSLYRFGPDGGVASELASSLEVISGGVRVSLARWRWSNGRHVTARDVVASVRRARPPSGFAPLRARRVGQRTVELLGAARNWRRALASAAFVLPRGRPRRVFGGPFALMKHVQGLEATFTPNAQWAGEAPYLGRVTVQFVSSLEQLIQLLEQGRLDAALLPSSVNLDERMHTRGIEVTAALGWERIVLDFRGAGLEQHERMAIAAAVKRTVIERGLIRDDGRVANRLDPAPGGRGADGPYGRVPHTGAPPDGSILLSAPAGDELLGLIQRMIQLHLARRRIKADVALVDPVALYGGGPGNPEGVAVLRLAGAPRASGGATTVRPLQRWPLFHVETVVAADPRLRNIEVNPTREGPLWNAERWWWDG